MADPAYVHALDQAERDRKRLLEQRDAIDVKVARLEQTIAGLSALVDPDGIVGSRPTQLVVAVRNALKLVGSPITPVDLREGVDQLGYQWKNPVNAMNSIHVVLKRLIAKGEVTVRKHVGSDGTKSVSYQWNPSAGRTTAKER